MTGDLLAVIEVPSWMAFGRCAETDPDLWFPEKGGGTRAAKAVCRSCGVRNLCLTYALETGQTHGIWGGMSPEERQRLRRQQASPVTQARRAA